MVYTDKNSGVIGEHFHVFSTLSFWRRSRCKNQIWAIYHHYREKKRIKLPLKNDLKLTDSNKFLFSVWASNKHNCNADNFLRRYQGGIWATCLQQKLMSSNRNRPSWHFIQLWKYWSFLQSNSDKGRNVIENLYCRFCSLNSIENLFNYILVQTIFDN